MGGGGGFYIAQRDSETREGSIVAAIDRLIRYADYCITSCRLLEKATHESWPDPEYCGDDVKYDYWEVRKTLDQIGQAIANLERARKRKKGRDDD